MSVLLYSGETDTHLNLIPGTLCVNEMQYLSVKFQL